MKEMLKREDGFAIIGVIVIVIIIIAVLVTGGKLQTKCTNYVTYINNYLYHYELENRVEFKEELKNEVIYYYGDEKVSFKFNDDKELEKIILENKDESKLTFAAGLGLLTENVYDPLDVESKFILAGDMSGSIDTDEWRITSDEVTVTYEPK